MTRIAEEIDEFHKVDEAQKRILKQSVEVWYRYIDAHVYKGVWDARSTRASHAASRVADNNDGTLKFKDISSMFRDTSAAHLVEYDRATQAGVRAVKDSERASTTPLLVVYSMGTRMAHNVYGT